MRHEIHVHPWLICFAPKPSIQEFLFKLCRHSVLERIKKLCSRSERGFLGLGEALAKAHVPGDL